MWRLVVVITGAVGGRRDLLLPLFFPLLRPSLSRAGPGVGRKSKATEVINIEEARVGAVGRGEGVAGLARRARRARGLGLFVSIRCPMGLSRRAVWSDGRTRSSRGVFIGPSAGTAGLSSGPAGSPLGHPRAQGRRTPQQLFVILTGSDFGSTRPRAGIASACLCSSAGRPSTRGFTSAGGKGGSGSSGVARPTGSPTTRAVFAPGTPVSGRALSTRFFTCPWASGASRGGGRRGASIIRAAGLSAAAGRARAFR